MAVRKNNVYNSRKAVLWDERDDAQLTILLKRKIKDTTIALRESETPYERSRLKSQRERYKSMLNKVQKGAYNGDIIFNELRASAALRQEAEFAAGLHSSVSGGRAYNNSYGNMDFDYEAAFRKKRYYGAFLPILMTVLSLLLIGVLLIGILSPSLLTGDITDPIREATSIDINALYVYRLEKGKTDIVVKPDENGYWTWPEANYPVTPTQGKPYVNENDRVFDSKNHIENGVSLVSIGCTEIYIDASDIMKAWFKTKMLEKTRIDIIEDLEMFQGTSYYYEYFLKGTKADELVIKKNEDGNYDFGVIYNHIGVYGTIIFLLLTIVLAVVLFIENLIRIFTYTSRRLHITTIFTLLSGVLAFLCPAFATCEGTEIGEAMSNYFLRLSDAVAFVSKDSTATMGASLLFLIPLGICVVLLILPLLFKNKYNKMPAHIPKGNRKINMN